MVTDLMSYDPNEPFRLEDFGFVLDSVEELPHCLVASMFKRGDLFVTLFHDSMIVFSERLFSHSQIGNGILYAGNRPCCHHHGKILFEMMPYYSQQPTRTDGGT